MRHGFAIDQRTCIGSHACTVTRTAERAAERRRLRCLRQVEHAPAAALAILPGVEPDPARGTDP
jgi:Fe-S-cluster-containing dehydrogenase component